MNGQDMGEPEPQTLDVLNRLIEMTTTRLIHWIDHLHGLVVHGGCTVEVIRVLAVLNRALIRLLDERDLLAPSV